MTTTIATSNRFQVRYFVGNRAEVCTPFQVVDIHRDETVGDYGSRGGPAVVSRHGTREQAQKAAKHLNS